MPKLRTAALLTLTLISVTVSDIDQVSAQDVIDKTSGDSEDSSPKDQASPKKELSPAMKDAIAHMARLKVFSSASGDEAEVELNPNPVLVYDDVVRGHESGTLWVWGKTGRPVALMELYRDGDKAQPTIHALTMTSPDLIRFKGHMGPQWTPESSHFNLQDVPNSPEVGDTRVVRMRQMKAVARQFTAHELWGGRQQLRLLIQPVHRYEDESNNVVDGAVFVLAHATNPEVILQIEAIADNDKQRWKYSLARLGSAELHVEFDNKEVWSAPSTGTGTPLEPYWLLYTPASGNELKPE